MILRKDEIEFPPYNLTTDDGIGDDEGAPGTDIFSSGIGFVTPASTVLTNCTTFSAGGGTGMTVNESIVGNAIVTMQSDNVNFYAYEIIKVTSGFDFKKTIFSAWGHHHPKNS